MFAAFGLGAQEILLLACCAVVPVAVGAIVFVVIRASARKTNDDPNDTGGEPDA